MLLRALLAWLLLLFVAVANGALRELIFVPRFGSDLAHVVSTAILCAAILCVSWLVAPWIAPVAAADDWTIGVLWVALTLAFEFLAGHYLFGSSWDKLLADYNLARGRVWVFVPIVTLVAPAWARIAGR